MKKLLLSLIALSCVALAIFATDYGKTIIITEPAKPLCFTQTPDKYPALAPTSAPAIVLSTDSPAQALYAQISLLTRDERIHFFSILSGANKAKVWAIHLQSYAIDHDLTQDQQEFINSLTFYLKGRDLDASKSDLKGRAAALKAQAISLFGKEQAWELVAHLGGKYPLAGNVQVARFYLPLIIKGAASQSADLSSVRESSPARPAFNPPVCECATNSDWCWDPAKTCDGVPTNVCTWAGSGCGFLWSEPCSGMCILH